MPCIFDVVCALLRCEAFEQFADSVTDRIDGARGLPAQQGLEFGEDLLDGVEVWGVFGQEDQVRGGVSDGLAHGLALV